MAAITLTHDSPTFAQTARDARPRASAATPARLALAALAVLCAAAAIRAQSNAPSAPDLRPQGAAQSEPLVVEGDHARDVFGMGRTVVVRGRVRHGVMAFGGDVVVEGRVEGDVAALGGTVVQREGSWIGGDVWVFGGSYQGCKFSPGRDAHSSTVMYAGYEDELREVARNPARLLAPRWSLPSLGLRVLSVLFWFILSLGLTAAAPGAVGRAAARLQLASLRVALIGVVGSVLVVFGVPAALHALPPLVGTFVFTLAIALSVFAYFFGRVAVHAATGRWLQRALLGEGHRSESVALLAGAVFWTAVLSLPYVWPLAAAALVVVSFGIALTARYRLGWRQAAKV